MKKFILILMCCLIAVPISASADGEKLKVPVLMYHAVEYANGGYTDRALAVSEKRLEEHIRAIIDSGYSPILFQELIDYVDEGKSLPENPVCLTFDDGYLDNYTYAFPLLKKYNCKATIFVIGSSIGKDTYKDTGYSINEHFGYDLADEMLKSGLVDIQSHTYDMHQSAQYEEKSVVQSSVLKTDDDSMIEYVRKFKNDFNILQSCINENLNHKINVLAYPGGYYDNISETLLRQSGIRVTLTTIPGINYIEKGNKECLYKLKRITVEEYVTPEMLIRSLQGE